MKTFKIQLQHDNGYITIKTVALDKYSAIDNVLKAEKAPYCAVVNVQELNTSI